MTPSSMTPSRPITITAASLLALLLLSLPAAAQRRGERARRMREVQDLTALQPSIDEAIDRGVEYLLAHQQRDGSWAEYSEHFGSGQTALSLYALLKSGVHPRHPAIESGFAWLDGHLPTKVYSISCHLLAYAARPGVDREDRIEELLEQLLDWQAGSWGYPGPPPLAGMRPRDGMNAFTDLSNTQFAALGLRAAEQAGHDVPAKVWQRLIDATLRYQEAPSRVDDDGRDGRSSSGTKEVAGFAYHPVETVAPGAPPGPGPGRGGGGGGAGPGPALGMPQASGSMTAAGIAVLEICRAGLGRKLTSKLSLTLDTAQARAFAWFDGNFAIDTNPDGGGWLHYYLYGLERIGSLLDRDEIAGRDWYFEGARQLVSDQARDGSWRTRHVEPSTCFALLFLQRATAPVTGSEKKTRGRARVSGGDVQLRATGSNPLTIWITGFDERVLRSWGHEGAGPRIARVEYLVDGKAAATVDASPRRGWRGEQHAERLTFSLPGRHEIGIRVHVVRPEAPLQATQATVVLETEGFEVDVETALSDWMVPFSRLAVNNLLLQLDPAEVEVSASSTSGGASPHLAVDGHQGTSWLARGEDLQPTLDLQLPRSIKADVVSFSGPDACAADRGWHDTLARAVIRINGKYEHSVTFAADPLRPALLHLDRPRAIRRLEIELPERIPGSGHESTVGLAEVGLYLSR